MISAFHSKFQPIFSAEDVASFILCSNGKILRKVEDFLFYKNGVEIFVLQFLELQPLKSQPMLSLLDEKRIPFGKQTGIRNIHQKINTEFMVLQAIHIFFEKALVEPKGTDDLCGNV